MTRISEYVSSDYVKTWSPLLPYTPLGPDLEFSSSSSSSSSSSFSPSSFSPSASSSASSTSSSISTLSAPSGNTSSVDQSDLKASDSFTDKLGHKNSGVLYRILVMNIGDSRALLGHENGSCIPISRDHKPDNEEEKKRITNAKGKVKYNRVDGDLALSRAMGDFFYKSDQTRPKDQQKVISVPEFRIIETTDIGHFIFLACDGVYDVMSNQEIINFICKELNLQKKTRSDIEIDVGEILTNLLGHCLQKESKDNMTAALIRLVDGSTAL